VFVSQALHANSIASKAVEKAVREAVILASRGTLAELEEVLGRQRFDKIVSQTYRHGIFRQIVTFSTLIDSPLPIRACRDPKDDKFLELAVHGRADAIVTGDQDLLTLNPFRGIAILTPADYLKTG
jgi:putative PIN family toxin of toxin-antitoxin system